jgi:hypothetical protein
MSVLPLISISTTHIKAPYLQLLSKKGEEKKRTDAYLPKAYQAASRFHMRKVVSS